MKKYSLVILGVASFFLLASCKLFEDSYRPRIISAYPSPSESGLQWDAHKVKVRADIISADVECIPVRKVNETKGLFEEKIRAEYEIIATAHISYEIIDKGFFKKGTDFSSLEANVIFEAFTGSGVRLALARGPVRFVEEANSATTSVKISGLSVGETNRVIGVQARWDYGT